MTIEKFLAMEDGEPGYSIYGSGVTYWPSPQGGNGIELISPQTSYPWQREVGIPVTIGSTKYVEFTSDTSWGVGFRAGGVGQCGVRFHEGALTFERRQYSDNVGVLIAATTPSIDTDATHRWGIKVYLHETAGYMTVVCDGVELYTIPTAKTTAVGGPSVNCDEVSLGGFRHGITTPPYPPARIDSVVISDAFEGDCHVDYLVPDGNGDTSQWVGSDSDSVDNWQLVDKIPASATDYVEADATDLRDLYTVANLPASGTILGVQAVVHPWKLGPGAEIPTSTILKTSAGEYVDLIEGMSTVMQGVEAPIRTTRPGGGAWTVADINSLQIGVTTEEP